MNVPGKEHPLVQLVGGLCHENLADGFFERLYECVLIYPQHANKVLTTFDC